MANLEFQESLDYLYGLQRFGMVFGLRNIENIAQALGSPHADLRAIHIGGTNGKGSTAAMIDAMLREGGYRVGLYTSPHVVSFVERIQVNGQSITEKEVAELTARIKNRIEEAEIPEQFTFFDFTTAMAFLYFAESKVDVAIVEVGLGGRLDSTNILNPVVSVITNVSREHRDVLGESLEEIAGEKAGIIKEGVPLVTGVSQESVFLQLERICQQKKSPLYRLGKDFSSEKQGEGCFHFRGRHQDLSRLKLNLLGEYQIENATMALGTLETLAEHGFRVNPEAVYRGLERVTWPGRLEVVREKPWVVLDAAHNPSGARALREALSELFAYDRCYLLLGIMKDKEVERIVSVLAPIAHETVLCRPSQDRAAPPERLKKALEAIGGRGRIVPDVGEGLDALLATAGPADLICVAGSFYTIGEAKTRLLTGS
jgi:dihydrofolate synthase/folylpolyglutamate synthase